MNGIQAFLEMLAQAGVRYIFGNPGTTELPLNEALAHDDRFRYILGLQEIPVLAMADGLAQASRTVGVVNLHTACGLGNAMGMLYNAHCEGAPLLVTAGQQDRRLALSEPVLAADLVSVARPWTKWAAELNCVEDFPVATRRALQTALAPPTGPVFLSFPLDLQQQTSDRFDLDPPHPLDTRIRPPLEAIRRAADLLLDARRPAILAGSRVTESDACVELAALAELLGAPVFADSTTAHGRLPLAADHPLYAGTLPLWSPEIRARLEPFDVLLAVGINLLRLYIHAEPERALPDHSRIIQLDNDSWQIGKTYAVEVGLLGDPRSGLLELAACLEPRITTAQREAAKASIHTHARRRREEQHTLRHRIDSDLSQRPMTSMALMGTLARVLPPRTAVVEEAITTHGNLLEKLGILRDPSSHFAHRGWALGWGLGCALGVKLAWPDRPVVGLLGDGAALYGIQGLWTAAREQIPVTFIICNNSQYRILAVCGQVMNLPGCEAASAPGLKLDSPAVDFVGLARAFGVEAHVVTNPEELADRLQTSFQNADRPLVLDARIA